MKQFILIITILLFSFPINAQPKSENTIIGGEQMYFAAPETIYGGKVEPNISQAARDFNSLGVKKALVEKNFEAAADLFRRAVESDRRCLTCQYNFGTALISSEKYDEAIKNFTDLVSVNPSHAYAYAGLGEAYDKNKLYKESVAAYEKAARLEPKDALLLSNFGNALYHTKDYKKALVYLSEAIEINPNFGVAYINRGAVLYAMGRYRDAVKSLQQALTILPNSAEAQNNLGAVLSSLGKEKEANQYYLEAVRLNPKWEVGLYNLALNNLALKKREDARRQLRVLEDVSPALAADLKKVFFGKYLINVSEVK